MAPPPAKGSCRAGSLSGLNSSAACLVQLANLPPRAANLGAGTLQHFLIGGVLPQHEVFDYFEQPLALDGSILLILPVFESAALLVARIID
jgi:hypothetical protein